MKTLPNRYDQLGFSARISKKRIHDRTPVKHRNGVCCAHPVRLRNTIERTLLRYTGFGTGLLRGLTAFSGRTAAPATSRRLMVTSSPSA